MIEKPIKVLQFITPVGFYGAERWVLALINNSDPETVLHDLAVTVESSQQDLEILNQFPEQAGQTHRVSMSSRFDLGAVTQLRRIVRERQIGSVCAGTEDRRQTPRICP